MAKIAFIGGGSAKFVCELTRDLFSFDELRDSQISLMDINPERMNRSQRLIEKMIADLSIPARVESTTDQRRALDGADYVVITIMVGGFKYYESDGVIPGSYGVLPTVGDTTGPGAVFRVVRTAPVLKQIADNLKEVSPGAWVLNYSNPMAMNTWTLLDSGHEKTVGLCHSIQGAYRQIASWLGIPHEEVTYTAGGINHIDFYLTLEHNGRDLYPLLMDKKDEILQQNPLMRVKFDLLEHLGHWPAEGEQHQNEYYPWFRKNDESIAEYGAETMWGYTFDSHINIQLAQQVEDRIAGRAPVEYGIGHEYGARIIHSMETGEGRLFYGNVRNRGLIENLPPQAIVETPCHVDATGIHPCRVGRIPPQLAAVMQPHISLHEMAVEGVRRKDREMLARAVQADPMTAAVLTLPKIRQMVDEMMAENAEYMRDW